MTIPLLILEQLFRCCFILFYLAILFPIIFFFCSDQKKKFSRVFLIAGEPHPEQRKHFLSHKLFSVAIIIHQGQYGWLQHSYRMDPTAMTLTQYMHNYVWHQIYRSICSYCALCNSDLVLVRLQIRWALSAHRVSLAEDTLWSRRCYHVVYSCTGLRAQFDLRRP